MMLKRYRHIILWSAASLLVAIGVLCVILLRGDSDRVRTMRDTWLLGQEHPDSALAIMQGVDTALLRGDREKALHLLFLTQAQYQAYSPECDLTRLDTLRTIFRDAPESPDKMLFLYLHGISLYDRKRYTDAIKPMLQALNIAEKENDYLYQGRICRELSYVYTAADNVHQSLKYSKKSLEAFRKSGNQNMANWAMLNISTDYSSLGDYKTALFYQDSCLTIARANNDSVFLKETCLAKGYTLYDMCRYREALDYMHGGEDLLTSRHAFAMGYMYLKLNNIDSAWYYSEIKSKLGDNTPNLEEEIKSEEKNYAEAYNDLMKMYNNLANYYRASIARNTAGEEIDYHEADALQKESRRRTTVLVTSALILLLLAVMLLIIWRLRVTKLRNLKAINELAENTERLNARIAGMQTEKNTEINNILSKQIGMRFAILADFCNSVNSFKVKKKVLSIDEMTEKFIFSITNTVAKYGTSDETIHELEKVADSITGGMIKLFKKEIPALYNNPTYRLIFLFKVNKINSHIIAYILGFDSKKYTTSHPSFVRK